MTPSQYICLLQRHVVNNYEYDRHAAAAFECSPGFLSMVLNGSKKPSKAMLEATGHHLRETIKRQYLKGEDTNDG